MKQLDLDKLKIIVFNLNGVYFHQIKSGVKTEEYREANDYWKKRLNGKSFDIIRIALGYPKKDDPERNIFFKWNGFEMKKITHEIFDNKEKEVFAINLKERL